MSVFDQSIVTYFVFLERDDNQTLTDSFKAIFQTNSNFTQLKVAHQLRSAVS